jgi:DNA mismatch repair protein MutS
LSLAQDLDPLDDLARELTAALCDRPPAVLAEGGVIREGYDAELDEARALRDGDNTLTLTVPAGSVTAGVVYDYLRLELDD